MKRKLTITMSIMAIMMISIVTIWIVQHDSWFLQDAQASKPLDSKKQYKSTHVPAYKDYKHSIHLAAIGDVLIHDTVYEDAKINNTYDFKPMFTKVKSLLQQADITIANQESMAGGTELGLSSYPCFNSPHEIIDALTSVGVDIVSIANNHTLDRGEKGILSATAYYNKINLPYEGSYRNEQDRETPRIITKDGISLGFLAYTYGTNGIPVPDNKDYLVNLIDENKIKSDIDKIKPLCDVVVVSMHWGNEYQRMPTDDQRTLAIKLANDGADIIIGHHPHVLQPMEWITRDDGHKSFVAYSLGNFISGQERDYKDIGGILNIEIVKEIKENTATITLQNPLFTPTYVSSTNQHHYQVIPLADASLVGVPNAVEVNAEINHHMNQWLTSAE